MYRILVAAVLFSLAAASSSIGQTATVRIVPGHAFPASVDSNSPALRMNGQFVLYNSTGLGPVRSSGPNQMTFLESNYVSLVDSTHRPYWIEATWLDQDGTIFAWYHHEPRGVCGGIPLTAPQIGALVSFDGGNTFIDLGIVLESGYPYDCFAQNGYFAGGHGDFSVVLGLNQKYFYFLFSNYSGPLESQGVVLARMPVERRYTPVGAVEKYFQGGWSEPGLGGQVSALFPVNVDWSQPNTDAFWGPSVHWNTYLKKFVMLLNRSCCAPGWPQEGVYVSFNNALANAQGWSTPVKLLDSVPWYPQVVGLGPAGTDKRAGRVAPLYIGGVSYWDIVFDRPEPPEPAAGDARLSNPDRTLQAGADSPADPTN